MSSSWHDVGLAFIIANLPRIFRNRKFFSTEKSEARSTVVSTPRLWAALKPKVSSFVYRIAALQSTQLTTADLLELLKNHPSY